MAHPMSKTQERSSRVPGFSTGFQKDTPLSSQFRRRGAAVARRPRRSPRPRTRRGRRIRPTGPADARPAAGPPGGGGGVGKEGGAEKNPGGGGPPRGGVSPGGAPRARGKRGGPRGEKKR